MRLYIAICFLILLCSTPLPSDAQIHTCHWFGDDHTRIHSRISNITLPEGYQRCNFGSLSFEAWLRSLPLKAPDSAVMLYDGTRKPNQSAHTRVIDIDAGSRDLQQCADAVMRLAAEFLYQSGRWDDIAFDFTSGDRAAWNRWSLGWRPRVSGNEVRWKKTAEIDSSYRSFRKYLNTVFSYAGSYSLSRELVRVPDADSLRIGDVFIQGGFPGHAVMVVDVAIHARSGDKVFLLAQSYMPAQDIHILKNPGDAGLSPWYKIHKNDPLVTPEWTFEWSNLKRFAWME